MPHVPYSGEPNGKTWDSIGTRDADESLLEEERERKREASRTERIIIGERREGIKEYGGGKTRYHTCEEWER